MVFIDRDTGGNVVAVFKNRQRNGQEQMVQSHADMKKFKDRDKKRAQKKDMDLAQASSRVKVKLGLNDAELSDLKIVLKGP